MDIYDTNEQTMTERDEARKVLDAVETGLMSLTGHLEEMARSADQRGAQNGHYGLYGEYQRRTRQVDYAKGTFDALVTVVDKLDNLAYKVGEIRYNSDI